MFEGLVRQLILGYLGQFIKDIQKEQLKITLWNEEVLLENVELILEAFDYLRLPLALKQGRIGKLSIKIPWKKLGWDPIIIILEDVNICVCQRDDKEWFMDAVERREFASKKAQLAAAELAKLSRRVCDNQTGKSFTSYITAKILDSIQVSIKNVHVHYRDTLHSTAEVVFGLRFSSLTIMKQSPNGSSAAKVRGGQVNKLIEIQSLELYCDIVEKSDASSTEMTISKNNGGEKIFEADKYSAILSPLNVLVSLSVNRSGKLLNDAPQYTVNAEFASMAMSMDEVQLQQILSLYDYMSVCQLREKYGRFRPWWCPLGRRLKGWQRAWWRYAQESVLSDVRTRLKKSSWKYFGERLNARSKYVNLYKTKLKCLRNDQVIGEDVQHELEKMEKETDIDDILNYRSLAERDLEHFLVNPSCSRVSNGVHADKPVEDDRPPNKPRGWLNWLSYGMLGAGGTDDSRQFSGVISDDVIKDIYEATKFHPAPVPTGDSTTMDEVYLSKVRVNISKICSTLRSIELGRAIADLSLKGISIEGKVREKSAIITASVNSAQMMNPYNNQVLFFTKKVYSEDNVLEKQQPSLNIKVDLSPQNNDTNSSVKVRLSPTEFYCDSDFMKNIVDFFHTLEHLSFQQQRILFSLNGIDDLRTRILSKIDYVLSSHKKMAWDINLLNTIIVIPWENACFEAHKIVLEAGAISFASKAEIDSFSSHKGDESHLLKQYIDYSSGSIEDILIGFQLQDLYDWYEIQINDMEMKASTPSSTILLFEKFNASTSLASCILLDEPLLKGLEVCVQVPSLSAHFSVSTYGVIRGLIEHIELLLPSSASHDLKPNGLSTSMHLWFSVNARLDAINLLVDLEDNVAGGCTLELCLQMLDIRCNRADFSDCYIAVKTCTITAKSTKDDWGPSVLFSTVDGQKGHLHDGTSVVDGCITLHYEARTNAEWICEKFTIFASDLDIHCYPFIVRKVIEFFDQIAACGASNIEDSKSHVEDENFMVTEFENLASLSNLESIIDGFVPKLSNYSDLLLVKLNLGGVTLHFHDSSCIIGTVKVPNAKVLIYKSPESLDVICSTKGLVLSSSFCPPTINGFLWGPSFSKLSPILNLRVKSSRKSPIEFSFYVQKVSCMLPPEYLAIIIGYFSLPDWSSYAEEIPNFEEPDIITYNFEVVDCNVITPANSGCSEFLKVNIKQLCVVFSENCDRISATKDIPSSCCISSGKFADKNICLDFFGRDLSLSILLMENDRENSSNRFQNLILIEPLSADVWMRIPDDNDFSDSYPMCIMAMISDCKIHIQEVYAITGLEALVYVIDQFSLVEKESQIFTSDVPHFLHTKKQMMEVSSPLPDTSNLTLHEMRFCASSVSLKLHQLKRDSTYSELLAEAEMQFTCSLSLINGNPQSFHISLYSLSLFSLLNSVRLAEFTGPGRSVLDLILSVSDHGENRLVVSLPCLDVWLHLFDWNEVFDLFSSISEKLSKVSNLSASENTSISTLILENVGLAVHFPAQISNKHALEGQNRNYFLSVSLQSRSSELIADGKTVKLTIGSESVSGMLKLYNLGSGAQTWPIFQLSNVHLEAEIFPKRETENLCLSAAVRCESLTLSLSNHMLYLLHFTWFKKSEEMGSQFYFKKMELKFYLRKFSLLITDWKTSSGPLLEFLLRNLAISSIVTEDTAEGSVGCDLQLNYYNIEKVLWEPFVEPWKFELSISRKHDERALFNNDATTDINLASSTNLNLNINEPLVEVAWRVLEMIDDVWALYQEPVSPNLSNSLITEKPETRRYAPYMLQNLTTLPLVFQVCQRQIRAVDPDVSPSNGVLQPGSSTLIYINESPEELFFRYRPTQSSDRLNDKQLLEGAHRYVTFELEGTTSIPSGPISMDLVGRRFFEVDFSKSSHFSEVYRDSARGFVVPVVVDVSVQRYAKLMRLYSTVVVLNATSVSLEVRFDIPFGVAPKILGPIRPGQEFPLPLHLTESGCIRWRPLGDSYLWSELHNISNIISQDVRIGVLRSFVCYPSHPSSEVFRCCISVHDQCLPPIGRLNSGKESLKFHGKSSNNMERPKDRYLYQLMLTSPLVLKNYLMKSISLTLEDAGVTRSAFLSEVETSLFHIDSSHDLSLIFKLRGFKPSVLKFPRAESFGPTAKFSGTKFSSSEIVLFDPEFTDGPLYVTMERVMDAFSGAREILISVPFLLYNCTGFSLTLSNSVNELKGYNYVIPSCYNLDEKDVMVEKKDGLGLICSSQDLSDTGSSNGTHLKGLDFVESDCTKATPCMFSPDPSAYSGEVIVKLSKYIPSVVKDFPKFSWSDQFSLVPTTGSTGVLVPQPSFASSGHVVSVCAVATPFPVSTKIITFQPRYVIANACAKNLCYKQKGTNFPSLLGSGQHSHIQWMDTARELLLSIRFEEPGWEWSGCFLPEQLGDTQVKIRNFMTGAVSMMRVEVCSADVSVKEEKIVESTSGNSETNLIILSVDDTGFMPYRIDNISRERLRIYQPKCESFETVIHPYTSSPYAWDEPYYPHSLVIEVPGERILGSYAIDNALTHSLVCLPATSEKPERKLIISVHSEGAIKVLSIVDSGHHGLNDLKNLHVPQLKDKRKQTQKFESLNKYKEKFSVDIPFIGVSLMNSQPEELLFACAKNTKVNIIQSLDQQQFSIQIASLQIDNQLRTTPYPVILSFNRGSKGNLVNSTQVASANSHEQPVFSLAVAKWRNDDDSSLVSFESISLRISDFYLEIEQEIVLRLFEFFKTASSRLQSRVLQDFDLTSGNSQYFVKLDEKQPNFTGTSLLNEKYKRVVLLPQMVPIGAPWQKINFSSRKQKKIYVELFDLAPITLTLSFSSSPWMLRHGVLTSGESLIHRGLMALADVEGAKIHFKHFVLSHQIASWDSIQEIIASHYTRQFLHEMYKVFGSAGVIGNPMGFARTLGLGIKDFFALPIWNVFQSPAGLITGMAQGTSSLFSNTVYAISDATTQFSKTAHKGIVAFTFDDHTVTMMEKQHNRMSSHSKGVINEFLEGLTGVLQSPIKGAEKHGLPGVLSGIALGVTGLVARPAASILEVTGKTAQSIRNRSGAHQKGPRSFRVRFPRPLSPQFALKPYSWEEAVGTYILTETDTKLKDDTLIICKSLQQSGHYVLITERSILVAGCSSLAELGRPGFEGVPPDPKWVIQSEIGIDSVILADSDAKVVHIVGSGSDTSFRTNQHQVKRGGNGPKWKDFHTPLPLFQTDLEFTSHEEADEFLKMLRCVIERGKERGWGSVGVLHQSNIKQS